MFNSICFPKVRVYSWVYYSQELSSVTYDIYIQQEQEKNSNIVSNKVKKVNLAEPGPSCTVPQNGETSGLCNGEVEEANRQWKGLVHFLSIVTQIAPLPVSGVSLQLQVDLCVFSN